jgi:hypothetical protein
MTDYQPEADTVNGVYILVVYFIFKPFLKNLSSNKNSFGIYLSKNDLSTND